MLKFKVKFKITEFSIGKRWSSQQNVTGDHDVLLLPTSMCCDRSCMPQAIELNDP